MEGIQKTLSESFWGRVWADTNTRWHSPIFLLAEAVGAAVVGLVFNDGWLAVGFVIVVAMAICCAVAIMTPFRQRDDARKLARNYREKLKPKFVVYNPHIHNQEVSGTFFGTPTLPVPGKFVKIGVINNSLTTIEGCRAYLFKIEKYNNGSLVTTAPMDGDPIQLPWSRSPDESEKYTIELENNVPRYFTVLHADETNNKPMFFNILTPNNMMTFFDDPAIYRLCLRVSGRNVKTEEYWVDVTWTGKWDEITVIEQI